MRLFFNFRYVSYSPRWTRKPVLAGVQFWRYAFALYWFRGHYSRPVSRYSGNSKVDMTAWAGSVNWAGIKYILLRAAPHAFPCTTWWRFLLFLQWWVIPLLNLRCGQFWPVRRWWAVVKWCFTTLLVFWRFPIVLLGAFVTVSTLFYDVIHVRWAGPLPVWWCRWRTRAIPDLSFDTNDVVQKQFRTIHFRLRLISATYIRCVGDSQSCHSGASMFQCWALRATLIIPVGVLLQIWIVGGAISTSK